MNWWWVLLGLLVLLLLWELLQIYIAGAPPSIHRVLVSDGLAAPPAPAIPKILWTYWHAAPPPRLIEQCLANWRRFAPDHELRLLDRQTLPSWIEPAALWPGFDRLPAYRQADWLRLQLLLRHGGIWIDASIVLTRNLDWLHQLQQQQQAEYAGFYVDRYTTNRQRPIVENWFMAAVPNSRFITDLSREFNHALAVTEAGYLAELRRRLDVDRLVQGLGSAEQTYLIMHVAAAVLLDRAPCRYRLALLRAEDSAFALHAALRWRKRHLYARLALMPSRSKRLPMLIKLRGGERRVIQEGLSRRLVLRCSALGRYLA
jgi:hypothetical protein